MQTPVPKPTPAGEAPVPRTLFDALEELAMTRRIVIDRPKGSRHPVFPDIEYPLDYGYVEGTSAPMGKESTFSSAARPAHPSAP
jgi:hypothetical protein